MDLTKLPPVPIRNDAVDTRGYHSIAIDLNDPRASEPLVDLSEHGIQVVPYYHVSDGSNPPYGRPLKGSLPRLWNRAGLIPLLQSVNDALAQYGCRLAVYDAYRTIATQRDLWGFAIDMAASESPGLSRSELEDRIRRYCSDPWRFDQHDQTTWPTHSTGGAIDVVLWDLDGRQLDMGAAFDDLSENAHSDRLERELNAGRIAPDAPALLNRRLLYWTMKQAGFVNYPAEYWHFDYGNQMYAFNMRADSDTEARPWYGYCPPPQ